MRIGKVTGWAFCGLLLAAIQAGAHAQSCNVGSASVTFGSYVAASNLDAIGTVNLSCDKKVNVVMKLNAGNGVDASFAGGRRLTRSVGGQTLIYNLYANSGRTQVFGDGTSPSVTVSINVHKAYAQSIWARIPAGQSTAFAGNYTDTVLATITY